MKTTGPDGKLNITFRMGCLLMALLSIARGSSFLFSKSLLGSIAPLNLLGVRFLLAFLILFALSSRKVISDIRNDHGMIRSSFLLAIVYFVCMAAELTGLKYTTAATCSLIENSAIVIVPIAQAFLLRKAPKPVVVISALMTFLGIGLIVMNSSSGTTSFSETTATQNTAAAAIPEVSGVLSMIPIGIGELLCILAALTYAAAIIITDRLSKDHDPMTLGILYVGMMGLMGIAASFIFETPHLPSSLPDWLLLLVLSFVCTAFAFAAQPVAQKPLSPETSSIICAVNPLTTAVLGWIVMGESLTFYGIAGTVLIITGIILPNVRHFRS